MGLFPYQVAGASWLAARRRALLADEQGLGKTITAIRAAVEAKCRRILVVAPTVVAYNWESELRRWAPELTVAVGATGVSFKRAVKTAPNVLIVTHTGTISGAITRELEAHTFDLLVVDEAHCFRNDSAQRTRALYGSGGLVHRAHRVWLLTGTPMPNHAGELWPMLRGLWPDRCPYDYETYLHTFCDLRWSDLRHGWKVTGNKKAALPELKQMMDGIYLRRLKKDYLKDLPPIRWSTVALPSVGTSPELREMEAQFRAEAPKAGDVLEWLRHNKQFAAWRRLCGLAKMDPAADLLLMEQEGTTHKTIVFAHHLDVLDGLEERLGAHNTVKITGAVSAYDRQRLVAVFQSDPTVRVALCQINAAGVGITLTAATEVVFVEASFVPGDNYQAADRAHRIGQTGSVNARFLTLANSVDELASEILARKEQAIREVLGEKSA